MELVKIVILCLDILEGGLDEPALHVSERDSEVLNTSVGTGAGVNTGLGDNTGLGKDVVICEGIVTCSGEHTG